MSLTDLGQNSTLSFYGIRAPPLLSSRCRTVGSGISQHDGEFSVRDPLQDFVGVSGRRVIAKLGLPLADQTPLVIPLARVEVVDNAVNLTMKLAAMPDDQYCLDWYNPVGSSTARSHLRELKSRPPPSPTSFRRSCARVTIAIPSRPLPSGVRHGGSARDLVDLAVPQAGPCRSVSFPFRTGQPPSMRRRSCWNARSSSKKVRTRDCRSSAAPVFRVARHRSPDNIEAQARFLTDGSIRLAVSGKAVAGAMHAKPPLPGDVTTLKALGQPNLSSVGVSPRVSIELDQTKFGHSTQGYRLHLMGRSPRSHGISVRRSRRPSTVRPSPAGRPRDLG